jgi:hypothetical protein
LQARTQSRGRSLRALVCGAGAGCVTVPPTSSWGAVGRHVIAAETSCRLRRPRRQHRPTGSPTYYSQADDTVIFVDHHDLPAHLAASAWGGRLGGDNNMKLVSGASRSHALESVAMAGSTPDYSHNFLNRGRLSDGHFGKAEPHFRQILLYGRGRNLRFGLG